MPRKINYKLMFEAVQTVKQVIDIGKQVNEYIKERREDASFRVSLRETDQAYQQAHGWLLNLIPQEDARRITARTSKNGLQILYDSKEIVEVDVDGHKVQVYIETPQPPSANEAVSSSVVAKSMVFRCNGLEAVEAIKRLLVRLHEESRDRPALLYTPGRWDAWDSRGPANKRPLESIVLREGLIDALTEDLDKFINSEERYIELGIPFHRGYLFYGPPGTGKTSIARALAARVGGDVYSFSLNSMKDNNELNDKVGEINIQEGSCAALVLEDIDVVHSTQDRESTDTDSGGVTLDGLLNVLDGMFTPDGLVVFMTTNRIDGFDDALIRPGRVDIKVEIDYLDNDQFERLCARFLQNVEDLPRVDPKMKISAADVVGIFKEFIDHPQDAYDKIVDLVLERGYADDYVYQ